MNLGFISIAKMKNLILIVFLILAFGGVTQNKIGIEPKTKLHQVLVKQWTNKDGLPANSITHSYFASNGFLWVASYNGLMIFDGYEFITYNKNNLPVLVNNGIYRIFEGNDNDIWICTNGSGLLRYKDQKFERVFEKELPTNVVSGFVYGETIWVGTVNKGLYKIVNNTIEKIDFEPLSEVSVINMDVDKEGAIWFCTDGKGVSRYKNGSYENYSKHLGNELNRIQDIYSARDGTIWIGTFEGVFNYSDGEFVKLDVLDGYIVSEIDEDDYGNLWLATNNGLVRKNAISQEYEFFDNSMGLPTGELTSLEFDNESNLWLTSTRDGLIQLRGGKFFNYTMSQGLSAKRVNAFLELENNQMMVGLENGDIQIISDDSIDDFTFTTKLPSTRIRDITKDSDDNLWISTYLGILKISSNGIEKLYTTADGLPTNQMRQIIQDSRGVLWVATRNAGVIKWYPDGTIQEFSTSNSINANFIMSMELDIENDERLILSTNDGGISIINKNDSVVNYGVDDGLSASLVFATYSDGNKLWAATNFGLNLIVNDTILVTTVKSRMLNETIFDIQEDNSGKFWITCSQGVIKVDKLELYKHLRNPSHELKYEIFDERDGLISRECIGAVLTTKSSDGKLWFPTLSGLAVIDPHFSKEENALPEPFILNMNADNTNFNVFETPIIDAGYKRFTFEFTAPNFTAPEKVKFKYKLEGYDNEWNELKRRERQAQYTNLSHGKYVFKVMVSNSDGIWNDNYESFTFTVKKYYYERWGFIGLAVLALSLFIYGIYKWRVNKIENEKRNLEIIVKQRTSEIEIQKEEISSQRDKLINSLRDLEIAQETINNQNEKLKDHNDELEVKVKQRTEELKNTVQKLIAANTELDHFLYRAAHDIRGPILRLFGIVNLAKVDNNYLVDSKFQQDLNDTIQEMDNLVLRLMRINELKNTKPVYKIVDIDKLIRNTFNEVVNDESIKLKTKVEVNRCSIDPTLLGLMLSKIFDNSKVYMDNNKQDSFVKVKVDMVDNSNQFRISIADNGIGIEKNFRDKVFDMFSKGHNRGVGLGLYEARLITKKLRGKIRLLEKENEEVIFEIILPCNNENLNELV